MTTKEQQAAVKSQRLAQQQVYKDQKQSQDESFKRDARLEALRIASRGQPTIVREGALTHPSPKYDLIKEAEKIYQWLIKVLR